jgi:hypothetical protein
MSILCNKHNQHPETILFRQFEGEIQKEDILESWEQLIDNELLNKNIKGIINNLNGCEFMLSIDDFNYLLKFLNKHECIKKLKIAVVADSPKKIIFPMLGEKQEKELNIKPFSSNKAAEEWILSN